MVLFATHQFRNKLLDCISFAGSCRSIDKEVFSKMKFINIE